MTELSPPSKIICVGRNYVAHAAELGNEVPDEPLLFFKPLSSIIGNGESIELPSVSVQVEHEGEIAVVIGRLTRRIPVADAMSAVAAVACLNDVTARDLQRSDSQWTRAKGFDTFCPFGTPVRLAQAPPLDELEVICRVNGEVRQHGYARDMAFDIPALVAYASNIMTLEPGDILTTGSPEGVGPLTPGDVVEVEIPGVGTISNPVVAEAVL